MYVLSVKAYNTLVIDNIRVQPKTNAHVWIVAEIKDSTA